MSMGLIGGKRYVTKPVGKGYLQSSSLFKVGKGYEWRVSDGIFMVDLGLH